MPQKIICGGCGEILYNMNDLKSPNELLEQLKGVCPRCSKKLSFDPTKVDIGVLQEEEKIRR
ncbi:MAG: hypothetical protein V1850_07150 [Candidatus Bathyarchaeota archaeon]